ncbi:MAG: hypothetical protein ACXQTR_05615 [Candidatus Methanospirareceae archaeon]
MMKIEGENRRIIIGIVHDAAKLVSNISDTRAHQGNGRHVGHLLAPDTFDDIVPDSKQARRMGGGVMIELHGCCVRVNRRVVNRLGAWGFDLLDLGQGAEGN